MTTWHFDVEDGQSEIWYQTMRLFNDGLLTHHNDDLVHGYDYSELKFVGVGGETGKEPIWNDSLFN